MNTLKKLKIGIDRRADHGGATRVWLRGELREHGDGLNHISFLLIGDEWRELFGATRGTFEDGYHLLKVFDELWTFADLDTLIGRAASGQAAVRYTRIQVPHRVRERMQDAIEQALRDYDNQEPDRWGDRETLEITYSAPMLDAWLEEFGRGKGSIDLQADADVRDMLGALRGEKTFDRSWNTIERLALGRTLSRHDKAVVRVSKDGRGFFWTAGGMHGGLINHGTEDEPDWSVHT